ncbi:MAG: InlB B-repeat-containing protein [Treponema sp.]|nr:InlB B-repeat-containing protein [Treponema sp.]
MKKKHGFFVALAVLVFFYTGCGDKLEKFSVIFQMGKDDRKEFAKIENVVSGTKVENPGKPRKTGYDFDKWINRKGGAEFDIAKKVVTEDLTLYAAWVEKQGSAPILPQGIYPAQKWDPGIPGGIPNVTSVHTTLAAGSTAAQINAAIQDAAKSGASAKNPKVVKLAAGTFNISGTILLNKPGVILRGAGRDAGGTVLSGGDIIGAQTFISIGYREGWFKESWNSAVNVTANAMMGATTITVSSIPSGVTAGSIIVIDRLADTSSPYGPSGTEFILGLGTNGIRGTTAGRHGPAGAGGAARPVRQYAEVASASGNTITLKDPLNIDFPLSRGGKSLQPQVWNTEASNYQYIGLEDMKITCSAGDGYGSMIYMGVPSSYCWVKNVECDGTNPGWQGRHIEMNGYRNTVRDSYVHHAKNVRNGGVAYGICVRGSNGLIENNACIMLNKPLVALSSGGGNVIGYNYVTNAYDYAPGGGPGAPGWQETAIDASHGGYCHSDLYEGNYTANLSTDSTYGSNGQIVFFRNYASGRNADMNDNGSLKALYLGGYQQKHASIGNVLLHPDYKNGARVFAVPSSLVAEINSELNSRLKTSGVIYADSQTSAPIAVYRLGAHAWNLAAGSSNGVEFDDGRTYDNFHRHLDYNPIEGLYTNPSNSETALPDSLYLSGKPSWFTGTWPPVNPKGATHAQRVLGLPAKTRVGDGSKP